MVVVAIPQSEGLRQLGLYLEGAPRVWSSSLPLTSTISGLMRPLLDRTTGQYRNPLAVWTRLVTLTSRFIGDPFLMWNQLGITKP